MKILGNLKFGDVIKISIDRKFRKFVESISNINFRNLEINEINYISYHYLGYKGFLNSDVMILNIKIYKAAPLLTIARLIGNFVDAYWPNYLCIPTAAPPLPSPLEFLDFAHFSPSPPLPPSSPLISPRNAKFLRSKNESYESFLFLFSLSSFLRDKEYLLFLSNSSARRCRLFSRVYFNRV